MTATAGAGTSMKPQIRVTGHVKMVGKPLDTGKLVPAVHNATCVHRQLQMIEG